MNRQHRGKSSEEGSGASPLSLLVHAADSQRSSGKNNGKPDSHGSHGSHGNSHRDQGGRIPEGAPSSSLEEQLAQRQSAARAEALHHQGLLSQLRGGALGGDGDFFHQNMVAAQQQQQAAALALASDIRTAVAAAQLRQAAQLQNQDLLLARTAALQQLGLGGGGGGGGMEQLQQELELHRLEEYERRQLLAAAAAGAPMGQFSARQQLELQEAHMRQEQLDRQLSQANEAAMDRAGLRGAPEAAGGRNNASADGGTKDSFQKTPGSVVVPCRARGMPMDHNFKTAYFVIPENVEHGEELICSYFACRNAGIKFRYCTHCKVPVAKRNFRKRHKHGKSNANDLDEDGSVEEEEEAVPAPKPKKEPAPVKEEVYRPKQVPKPKKAEKPPKVEKSPKVEKHPKVVETEPIRKVVNDHSSSSSSSKKNKPSKESRLVSDDNDAPSLPPISHQSRPKIGPDRERLWGQLLAKRPPTKDGEAVSAWLMEVLSVSDLDTPLKENGQAQPAAAIALPFKAAGAPSDAAQAAAASFKNKCISKQEPADDSSEPKDDDDASTSSSSSSVVITKKRPHHAMLEKDDGEKEGYSSPPAREEGMTSQQAAKVSKKDVGSFAEWKDRKKHKGLPKKGFSMQSSE